MKRFLAALIVLSIFVGVAMADFTNHPRYAQIQTFTESVVQSIADAQNNFFVLHGRYFQGLWLLGPDVMIDGNTDETVINTSMPDDFGFSWKDFAPNVFKNNLKIPVNIRIDVYESAHGWGWIFVAEAWVLGLGPDAHGNDGDHWIYQHHEGPDTPQSGVWDKWHIVPETPE